MKKDPNPLVDGHFIRKALKESKNAKWENLFYFQIKAEKIPEPQRQYKFHPERKFRADFAWDHPPFRLLCEVDGGVWMPKGGHTSGTGYTADRVRDAEAILLGFKIMRFTPSMVEDGTAIKYLRQLFFGKD